jgi:hypothetical protein
VTRAGTRDDDEDAPPAAVGRFSHSRKGRLTRHDLGRFPGNTLFDRLARAVCHAGCLPRKELYEAWEVARRTRRIFRGGRVVDLAAGHGLLAHVMLLLDDSSPTAVAVDRQFPASSGPLNATLSAEWPRLRGRIQFLASAVADFRILETDVVVSSHACGGVTDTILERAASARARVAVLPCCHALDGAEARKFAGWMDGSLAVDVTRAQRLEAQGYRIWTQTIAPGITPKARLLLAAPLA